MEEQIKQEQKDKVEKERLMLEGYFDEQPNLSLMKIKDIDEKFN